MDFNVDKRLVDNTNKVRISKILKWVDFYTILQVPILLDLQLITIGLQNFLKQNFLSKTNKMIIPGSS